MEVFLYLLDMYIDFQFILSSCGCIGNKCMVGVGLPLPRRTKSFVPVLYHVFFYLVCVSALPGHRLDYYHCKALFGNPPEKILWYFRK